MRRKRKLRIYSPCCFRFKSPKNNSHIYKITNGYDTSTNHKVWCLKPTQQNLQHVSNLVITYDQKKICHHNGTLISTYLSKMLLFFGHPWFFYLHFASPRWASGRSSASESSKAAWRSFRVSGDDFAGHHCLRRYVLVEKSWQNGWGWPNLI